MKKNILIFSLLAILFASCGGNVANNNESKSEREVNWDCPICKISQNGDTICSYKYDQNGNLVELIGGDFVTRYQYDANNRLIKETNDCEYDAYIYDYVYDNQGRLIELNTNMGTNSTYTYQANKRIRHITGMREGMEEVNDYYITYYIDKDFKKDTLEMYFVDDISDESKYTDAVSTKYNEEGLKISTHSGKSVNTFTYKDNTCVESDGVVTYYEYK